MTASYNFQKVNKTSQTAIEITEEWCYDRFLSGETEDAIKGWRGHTGKALASLLAGIRSHLDYFHFIATDLDEQEGIKNSYREYAEDEGIHIPVPTFGHLNPRASFILTELSLFLRKEERELNPLACTPSSFTDRSYPYMQDMVVSFSEPQLTRNLLFLVQACKKEILEFPDLSAHIPAAFSKAARELLRELNK